MYLRVGRDDSLHQSSSRARLADNKDGRAGITICRFCRQPLLGIGILQRIKRLFFLGIVKADMLAPRLGTALKIAEGLTPILQIFALLACAIA